MITAQLVFLYTAECLSISEAAKHAHVTQQCASNHIKNLEIQYGVLLFKRKPSLSLTVAGECLYQSLRQIHLIEKNTNNSINEICKGSMGSLCIAINATRCRVLFPIVLKNFSKQFPNVKISLHLGDTIKNLQLLAQGKADIVIGVGAQTSNFSQFQITPLSSDRIFFLTSEILIKQYCPEFAEMLTPDGEVSIHTLSLFPFCRNAEGSTLTHLINTHLFKEKITLTTLYNLSDYDTQIDFCASNLTAAFCPSMMLQRVIDYNKIHSNNKLLFFPIKEITDKLRVDIFQNMYSYHPRYIKEFIQILKTSIIEV